MSKYLADILVTGCTSYKHLKNHARVFTYIAVAGLRATGQGAFSLSLSVEYLGYLIDLDQFHPIQEKVKAIRDAHTPSTITELRAFLRSLNYYARFFPNHSSFL